MATIKSYSGKTELYIGGSDGAGRYVRIENVEVEHADGAGDRFPRAELLKALNAVDYDECMARVEHLEGELSATKANRDHGFTALRDRAEFAEEQAEALTLQLEEARRWAETLQSQKFAAEKHAGAMAYRAGDLCGERNEARERAEETEAELADVWKSRAAWKSRAEDAKTKLNEAEAKLERVRGLWKTVQSLPSAKPGYIDKATTLFLIWGALGEDMPKPFELPTQVPARVEATRRSTGDTHVFYLWINGTGAINDNLWIDENDWNLVLTGAQLMDHYTDHRVIGEDRNHG